MVIAIKLIEDYKASLYLSTQKMGTPLHVACRCMSPLRYYYVTKCPTLLAIPDGTASLPFHIACQNNDTEFIKWLFESILVQARKHSCKEGQSLQLPLEEEDLRRVSSLPLMSRGKPVCPVLHSPVQTVAFHFGPLEEGEVEGEVEVDKPNLENQASRVLVDSFSASLSLSNQVSSYISFPVEQCTYDTVLLMDVSKVAASPASLRKIAEDKLLAITVQGQSMFHIAVFNNCTELLRTLLTVAWFMCLSLDLKLDLKVVFALGDETPVAMAIKRRHGACLSLLLNFLKDMDLLKIATADERLLVMAVRTGDLEVVKILVKFGIVKGLEEAISIAVGNHFHEVLRLLLYHHVQLTTMHNYRSLQSDHRTGRLIGEIKWSHLLLGEVRPEWIEDSVSAVESVYSAVNVSSFAIKDPSNKQGVLCQLASTCLRYFDEKALAGVANDNCSLFLMLVSITNVEISESGLVSVPPELFQMPHLSTLTLAQNRISELPSALNSSQEEVYTCRSLKKLVLDGNQLSTLPEDLFLGLVSTLEELSVQRNRLTDLPPGVWVMPHLKTLRLSGNTLSRLHYLSGSSEKYFNDLEADSVCLNSPSIFRLKLFYQTLCKALKAGSSNFEELVTQIRQQRMASRQDSFAQSGSSSSPAYTQASRDDEEDEQDISQLRLLDLSSNMFSEIPADLVCLAPRLNRLEMKYNQIVKLDLVHSIPRSVGTIHLDHNLIVNTISARPAFLPCSSPRMMFVPQPPEGCLYCSHASHAVLGKLTTLVLSYNKLEKFVVCDEGEHCPYNPNVGGTPPVTSQPVFPMLSILALDHNVLKTIPKDIHRLNSLGSLDFSYNVAIQELPLELGLLNPQTLCVLRLQGLNISAVPPSLLEKSSPRPLLTYLKAQLQRFVHVREGVGWGGDVGGAMNKGVP